MGWGVGAVASWLVRSSSDRAVRVQARPGQEVVLCSPGHGAWLSQYLSPPVEMVAGDLAAKVTLRWTGVPSGGGSRDVSIRVMQQRPG